MSDTVQIDDFEYAGDGLWLDGVFYPPVFGGDEGDEMFVESSDPDEFSGAQGVKRFPPTSGTILARGRELALSGAPLQLDMLLKSLSALRARASGSTAELFPAIMAQLGELRSQYGAASKALARRLGPSGGGQVARGRQQLLGRAGRQYGTLLNDAQQQGFAGLLNLQGGIQPFLSGAAREPNVQTGPSSFNPANAGAGIAGLVDLARQFNQNRGTQTQQPILLGDQGLPSNTTVPIPDNFTSDF